MDKVQKYNSFNTQKCMNIFSQNLYINSFCNTVNESNAEVSLGE
jgi:hypothetical protein